MVLSGKVAIITGGGSGIGAAIARAFAREGAQIVIADRNIAGAEAVAAECGNGASAFQVDVADVQAIRSTVAAVLQRHTRIDVLVNCAGIVAKCDFLDMDPDQFDDVLNINLRGTYFFGQSVARTMVRGNGGRIINIGSIAGLLGFVTRTAYGSSKAAVLGLTRIMAAELAQYKILVNAIAPGPIETPLVANAHDNDFRRRVLGRIPLDRYGLAEDIAGAAVYLASDASSYMTGQTITIDGGYSSTGLSAAQT